MPGSKRKDFAALRFRKRGGGWNAPLRRILVNGLGKVLGESRKASVCGNNSMQNAMRRISLSVLPIVRRRSHRGAAGSSASSISRPAQQVVGGGTG